MVTIKHIEFRTNTKWWGNRVVHENVMCFYNIDKIQLTRWRRGELTKKGMNYQYTGLPKWISDISYMHEKWKMKFKWKNTILKRLHVYDISIYDILVSKRKTIGLENKSVVVRS